MRAFILLFIFCLYACSNSSSRSNKNLSEEESSQQKPDLINTSHMLIFNKIDNTVNIFINDSMIFTSGLISDNPELDLRVDLTPFIIEGSEKLRIELYNGQEPYDDQIDPYWEVRYDLILSDELADFDHAFEKNNAIGLVYTNEYIISEWWILDE